MKRTLPWNVTGIPPEAREVARSAASREGIPVGEWLTRRILAEGARAGDAPPESGRVKTPIEVPEESAPSHRHGHDEDVLHDRDELAARLARSEAQTDSAFRRIDEVLRTLAQRLELSERTQTDAHRAMGSGAAEINAAGRDQAQAFQLLTTRIESVERQTDSAALRDAVRAMHQGLSCLTDQIAKTANDSTEQIATLAGNIEELAGRIANAREGSHRLGQSVEDRFAALDERIKETEHRIESSLGLEEGLKWTEEARLRQTAENIVSSSPPDEIEAKLEARLYFAEERTQEVLERHFASMGHNLEGLASRLEKIESRGDSDTDIQNTLGSFGARIEATEKKTREALTDLEVHLGETAKRIENIEGDMSLGEPLAPTLPADRTAAEAHFDLPLFPESPMSEAEDHQTSGEAEYFSQAAAPRPTEALAWDAQAALSLPENCFAHARRAQAVAERGQSGKFPILFPGEAELAPLAGGHKSKRSRRGSQALAFAALLLSLIASGYLITRNLVRESAGVALQLNGPASSAGPSTPRPAATGKAAGTLDRAASVIPAETSAEESVSAVNVLPPPGSPATGAPVQRITKAPSGTAAPRQAATATVQQTTTASLAPSAGATNLSRLISQANSGDAKAALAVGLKYANGDGVPLNDAQALHWLQKAAEAGEALAQYRLGAFFEKGRSVDPDQDQAMRWYGEAAKHGNRKAMHALGVANANGIGGKTNFPEAVHWFKTAAQLGLTDSQFNLAVLYERGLGVQTSLLEAYKWYAIAAASGDRESKTRVGALATQISAAERDAADQVAKGFKPQPMNVAANDGPPLTSN
jgi:localization factor PodJL